MNNQEKPVPQLAQAINEDFATLDEELLESVTGAGFTDLVKSCVSCFKKQDPPLITNEHGEVAALHEVLPIWEKENPTMREGVPQPMQWSPRKVTASSGQTGYVRSPGGSLDGFRI